MEQDVLRGLFSKVKRLPAAVMDLAAQYVDEVGPEEFKVKLKAGLEESWGEVTKRLVLEMEKAKEQVVFLIDEFPQMIENIARNKGEDEARLLLNWFRALRLRQKDELRRFRFIVGGSTGIDLILRRLQVPAQFNDFLRLPVEPVSREDADLILNGLAENYQLRFTPEAIEKLFELIGPPVPYFIHLFISQIILDPQAATKEITPDCLERVYRERLLGPTCRAYFAPYRERLKRYGEPGERAAIAILQELAQAPNGRISDSALYDVYRRARRKGATDLEFREIMADLEYDWYITCDQSTNEYFFSLNLMRAWWNRFYSSLKRRQK